MTGPCGNKNCPHDLYNEQFGYVILNGKKNFVREVICPIKTSRLVRPVR